MEMAVQAQQPSSMFWPELQNRIQGAMIPVNGNLIYATPFSITPGTMEAAQTQPDAVDLLRIYNKGSFTGLNLVQQSMLECAVFNQLQKDTVTRTTKRPREVEARQYVFSRWPDHQLQQKNVAFVPVIPQSTATAVSPGLRFTADDLQVNLVPSKGEASSMLMLEELQSEIMKYKEDVDEFVNMQTEEIKRVLEEKSVRHATCLVKVQEELLQRLREKEAELDKAKQRNSALEERVKELSLESQLWEKVARDQEVMVSNLRTSLEQAIQLEDVESCHYGESRDTDGVALNEAEAMAQIICKACEAVPVSVLLLPCRHLCLCEACDKRMEWCPACGVAKIASLKVFMS